MSSFIGSWSEQRGEIKYAFIDEKEYNDSLARGKYSVYRFRISFYKDQSHVKIKWWRHKNTNTNWKSYVQW